MNYDEVPDDYAAVTPAPIVPSPVAAIIRTLSPMLAGWVLAAIVWAFTPLGVAVPGEFRGWLEATIPVVLGALYYVVARWLEARWPKVPWLGSTRQPLYTEPARRAAAD